jgi:hypothetical protein
MKSFDGDSGAESGNYFCNNVHCVLHVQPGDPGVHGSGNWAIFADGITVGRGLFRDVYLCDRCGRREIE